ncbi:MAG TPA: arylsulfotransferase family protein [Ignavibacteria bacterium]|nr:arylsulfotransferase family protein [Ignavibacteria bacterium]
MHHFFIIFIFLLSVNFAKGDIIYTEPVRNAKLVSINNNIIIGFDENIQSSDLLKTIIVKGSVSGIHSGKVILTKDKRKFLFIPSEPFAFNEEVEVKLIRLKTLSGFINNFSYIFYTQKSKPLDVPNQSILNETGNSDLIYNSQMQGSPDLPNISVRILDNPSAGKLFLGNFPFSQIPNTPYLLQSDNNGNISYFREVYVWALDYKRQPNGMQTFFEGLGYHAEDNDHNYIRSYFCGNGYSTDHHELQITNDGHAFLMSYDPQHVDMSMIVPGGNPNAIVTGLVIQEIDESNNVVFQWRSWDHMLITDAIGINLTDSLIDYVHGNAIDIDDDGHLLISSRHISEITKINRNTGDIIWRMGGKNNEFTFINDPIKFSYQHDIRRLDNGNVTLFDNGNYHSPPFSRAVEYDLDEVNKTATLVWQYRNTPDNFGFAMGSVQRLKNGNTLIGWGSSHPNISEVTPEGNIALEMTLPAGIFTYRVFRDEVKFTLNLKMAVEGFYNIDEDKLKINDTVMIYLRDINSPYSIVDSSESVIDSVNLTGSFNFYNVNAGTYYLKIKHRNSIETWSKTGGENLKENDVLHYDLTSQHSQAFGNNLTLTGSRYSIYSGDVNQDGTIDISDLSDIDNDVSVFNKGYVNSDITGDMFTDVSDVAIAENNAVKFISSVKP